MKLSLAPDWRCPRCGSPTPVRHYPPCDRGPERLSSPIWSLAPMLDLGVSGRAVVGFRGGAGLVLRGLA